MNISHVPTLVSSPVYHASRPWGKLFIMRNTLRYLFQNKMTLLLSRVYRMQNFFVLLKRRMKNRVAVGDILIKFMKSLFFEVHQNYFLFVLLVTPAPQHTVKT